MMMIVICEAHALMISLQRQASLRTVVLLYRNMTPRTEVLLSPAEIAVPARGRGRGLWLTGRFVGAGRRPGWRGNASWFTSSHSNAPVTGLGAEFLTSRKPIIVHSDSVVAPWVFRHIPTSPNLEILPHLAGEQFDHDAPFASLLLFLTGPYRGGRWQGRRLDLCGGCGTSKLRRIDAVTGPNLDSLDRSNELSTAAVT